MHTIDSDFKEMAIWGCVLLVIVVVAFAMGGRKHDPARDHAEMQRMVREAEQEARRLPRKEESDPRLQNTAEAARRFNEVYGKKRNPLFRP